MIESANIEDIIEAINKDIKNISRISDFAPLFIENGLKTELVELYKLDFYYNSNQKAFEAIGDIYYADGKYEDALNNYLNCAELSENYAQIFTKLADVFGKLNDEESQHACIEQAKLIGGTNG